MALWKRSTHAPALAMLLSLALPAGASPIGQPGWEIDYDLADAFLYTTVCLGECQSEFAVMGGGLATLQLADPDLDGFFEDGAGARLSAYELNVFYNVFGLSATTADTLSEGLNGMRWGPTGRFDGDFVRVLWDAGFGGQMGVHSVGTYFCTPGELCNLAIPPPPLRRPSRPSTR